MGQGKYASDTFARLVRLYRAWGKPEQAAGWQAKLDAFDKEKTQPEPVTKPGS